MFYVSVTSPPLKVNDIWMSFFENHVAIVTRIGKKSNIRPIPKSLRQTVHVMDPLETLEGPLGVFEPHFGNQ